MEFLSTGSIHRVITLALSLSPKALKEELTSGCIYVEATMVILVNAVTDAPIISPVAILAT